MSDELDINKLVRQYKQTREREHKYYHEVKKKDEAFIQKNRERAAAHYSCNKEKHKTAYNENPDFYKHKALYYYYKRNGKADQFKEKFPEKVQILTDNKFKF
tara:strand:- start:3267 stop:3572 length:306 start_codon:yes stop_codon:yes gene_type:complete